MKSYRNWIRGKVTPGLGHFEAAAGFDLTAQQMFESRENPYQGLRSQELHPKADAA
ncbi:MAG: hypothetical protein K0U98_09115 [Deltaproteobacteria bacterium]|nr:hypothetical protein [Deltaproteobacteria bacterium]